MKKLRKRILLMLLFLCGIMTAEAENPAWYNLSHVKGIHAVGLNGGTGWGNTFQVDVFHQYYFHRKWAYITHLQYERGFFNLSGFNAINLMPSIEASVWNPTTWCHLHLTADVILGWDFWNNSTIKSNANGFALGANLGFNFEFLPIPECSILVGAKQGWKYSWLSDKSDYNYFVPQFFVGVKYNIK